MTRPFSSLSGLLRISRETRRAPRRDRSPAIEDLEGRRLPSQVTPPLVSLADNDGATSMIAGPDGGLWLGVNQTATSAVIDRIGLDGSVTSFPVPAAGPGDLLSIDALTTGPDGNIWFDAQAGPEPKREQVVIGKMTPAGVVTEYPPIPVPAGQTATAGPIVGGPGGDLWFGYSDDRSDPRQVGGQEFIGRATTAGAVPLSPISSYSRSPTLVTSLAAGSDGNLWFAALAGRRKFAVVRMSPAGAVTSFPIRKMAEGVLANGPDGNLIVTGTSSRLKNEVYRVSTAGAVTHVRIPGASLTAFSLALGPAGDSEWFTDGSGALKFGRLTAGRAATSYDLSNLVPGGQHHAESIVVGSDGNLYWLDETGLGTNSTESVYRLPPGEFPPAG